MCLKRMFLMVIFMTATVVGTGYYLWPERQLEAGARVDFIQIDKSQRKMTLYYQKNQLASYTIALGANWPFFIHPEGPKRFEGDFKTPEGEYFINKKRIHPNYHRSLKISYPADDPVARKNGKKAGGLILIHGINKKFNWVGKFQRWVDWTAGCVAVTDTEIEEIYDAVPMNCKVEILP
ncbi:MAG: L,D-transpeptidase family protein [Cryomorphaceae bacterium]|nr:L,D-transpeptidase family protein [Cryomorphaceae bacterium]